MWTRNLPPHLEQKIHEYVYDIEVDEEPDDENWEGGEEEMNVPQEVLDAEAERQRVSGAAGGRAAALNNLSPEDRRREVLKMTNRTIRNELETIERFVPDSGADVEPDDPPRIFATAEEEQEYRAAKEMERVRAASAAAKKANGGV